MQLLVSDTNILIDIEVGNLTPVIFRLRFDIAVPDILFESELREQHSHLLEAGLRVKRMSADAVREIEALSLKYSRTSIMDLSALALAKQEKCLLLTGDRDLREAAITEGIEVHGTLWIVEKLLDVKLIEQRQARDSFVSMKAKGSRLPWNDVEKLLCKHEMSTER